MARLEQTLAEYEYQQHLVAEASKGAVQLAWLEATRLTDDTLATCTVWQQGTSTFLPDADVIGLFARSGESLFLPFGDVLSLAAANLRRLPVSPTRWQADRWPEAHVLEACRQSNLGDLTSVSLAFV